MDYRENSEIRDGMRIDWDMPITMDDGLVLRCDIYRPIARGQISGHHDLWPLRQVAAFRGPLQRPVGAHGEEPPGRADRLHQQVPELGSGRSGEVGAGWLCLSSASIRAARPLARLHRHLVAARGAGLRAMHRMGRRAAVVERQGRPERHLLLRREPVADARRCSRSISRRSASGKAPPISTATWRTTAASSARFAQDWSRRRSRPCSTASARAASRAA